MTTPGAVARAAASPPTARSTKIPRPLWQQTPALQAGSDALLLRAILIKKASLRRTGRLPDDGTPLVSAITAGALPATSPSNNAALSSSSAAAATAPATALPTPTPPSSTTTVPASPPRRPHFAEYASNTATKPALPPPLQRRVERALRARLYLLQQLGPAVFLVSTDDPTQRFRVTIGPQTCSCKRKLCLHLLFVMIRVLKMKASDPRLGASSLHDYEVESLVASLAAQRHQRTRLRVSQQQQPQQPQQRSRQRVDCPICLLEMDSGESLCACQECKNNLHLHCMQVWAECRRAQNEAVYCPLCRADWDLQRLPGLAARAGASHSARPAVDAPLPPTALELDLSGDAATRLARLPQLASSPPALPLAAPLQGDLLQRVRPWMAAFSERTVACLFARDWSAREMALLDVAATLRSAPVPRPQALLDAVVAVVEHACRDPVLKVYEVALGIVRILGGDLGASSDADDGAPASSASPASPSTPTTIPPSLSLALAAPLANSIVLKCADGNARIQKLSLAALVALQPAADLSFEQLLRIIFVADAPEGGNFEIRRSPGWRWWLGRLTLLEQLAVSEPSAFLRPAPRLFWRHLDRLADDDDAAAAAGGAATGADGEDRTRDPSFAAFASAFAALALNLQTHQNVRHTARRTQCRLDHLVAQHVRDTDDAEDAADASHVCFGGRRQWQLASQRRGSEGAGAAGAGRDAEEEEEDEVALCKRELAAMSATPTTGAASPSPCSSNAAAGAHADGADAANDNLGPASAVSVREDYFLASAIAQSTEVSLDATAAGPAAAGGLPESPGSPCAGPCGSAEHCVCASPGASPGSPPVRPEDVPRPPLDASPAAGALPVAISADYREGTHWGKGELLGVGGFSSCFMARDASTGQLMAVKQICHMRNDEADEQSMLRKVKREVGILASLPEHTHVIRYFGSQLDGNHFNVFMEYMAGGSIAAVLKRFGPFTLTLTRRYLSQVAAGLAFLHDHGILHRDLKPANLVLDAGGQTVKLCDFGAAAKLSGAVTGSHEFRTVCGTPFFMAPELIRGEGHGRKADVWSLGCVGIEMVSGRPPWKDEGYTNMYALLFHVARSQQGPALPTQLVGPSRDFVQACLHMEPDQRPSAADLLLHPFVLDEST